VIRGSLVDLSASGIGMIAEAVVESGSVMPIWLRFAGVPVEIPVFARVRWIRPDCPRPNEHRIGLSFLT
jgi:PilZ domain-containing protein